MPKVLRALNRETVFAGVLAIMFSGMYIRAAQIHPQSLVNFDPAMAMQIVYFRARFLLPFLIRHLLPGRWIDTPGLRVILNFFFSAGIFYFARVYFRRLGAPAVVIRLAPLLMFLVLVMHYAISHELNVYYVYDIPAILFYLVTFLLLTDPRDSRFVLGLAAVVVFATNRETITVAAFQAAGVTYDRWRTGALREHFRARMVGLIAVIAAATLIKGITLKFLGAGPQDFLLVDENGTLRLWANLVRIVRQPGYAIEMVYLGCGFLFWFPFVVPRLTRLDRAILWATLPTLPAYLIGANLTELRGYMEFTPLFALLLGRFLFPDDPATRAVSGKAA